MGAVTQIRVLGGTIGLAISYVNIPQYIELPIPADIEIANNILEPLSSTTQSRRPWRLFSRPHS